VFVPSITKILSVHINKYTHPLSTPTFTSFSAAFKMSTLDWTRYQFNDDIITPSITPVYTSIPTTPPPQYQTAPQLVKPPQALSEDFDDVLNHIEQLKISFNLNTKLLPLQHSNHHNVQANQLASTHNYPTQHYSVSYLTPEANTIHHQAIIDQYYQQQRKLQYIRQYINQQQNTFETHSWYFMPCCLYHTGPPNASRPHSSLKPT